MKKLTVFISAFLILCMLCGCAAGYIDEQQGDDISPVDDSALSSSSLAMPLHFRYYDEPMLIRSTINIETSPQQQPEYYAISALIAGPTGQRTELRRIFGKSTSLISVDADGEYLYVTLSDGFLSDTQGKDDSETRINRMLAIYSIVNTVCEMGNHSMVQIYIKSGSAALRPDAFEMGLAKTANDSAPLGALSRNTELILTPSNVVKTALAHYSNFEWSKLYYYLGDGEQASAKLPLVEEMSQTLEYLGLVMSEYSAEDNYTVAEDGKTATVQVSFKIRTRSRAYTVTNAPLQLVYKGHCWLISYQSLMRCLGVEG